MQLQSFAQDRWQDGAGRTSLLVDASTGDTIAEAASGGLDYRAMLAHARAVGGAALRSMTFHERASMLRALGKKLKMANAIQVLGITGYVVGSVSPLGHRQKLRTIVEATIPTLDVVLGGGGELNALLRLSTAELLRVVDPEVVALLIDDV
jgi:prolyl-tRNA editing enzyme YbaK/EbsC (Cys-tRNA(Pro) deacylase)